MRPILAIALALTATSAAFAQNTALRYADLDLSSAAGQAELERRIEDVVRKACRAKPATGTRIVDRQEVEQCKNEIRAQILAKLPR